MHLGDFGTERPPVEDTFGYFGKTLRIHPDLSDLAIMDLFSAMAEAAEDGTKVVDALKSVATTLVHPDDVDEFWQLVRGNRQTMQDLGELATELLGAVTGRPTKQPSDSSDGLRSTAASSTADSSSQAVRLLEGRPDLQVAVLRRERQAG